jgi:hypothetical protein
VAYRRTRPAPRGPPLTSSRTPSPRGRTLAVRAGGRPRRAEGLSSPGPVID